jgi:phage gp36-like protein
MRRAVCIIAAYDVITGRGYNTQNVGGDSDQLKERYDSIIQWLRDIARGDVTPVVTDSSTGGGGGGGGGGSGDSAAYVVAPRLVGGEYVVGPPVPRGW